MPISNATVAEPALDRASLMSDPGDRGRFGRFGGRFVPEALIPACERLEEGFRDAWADPAAGIWMLENYAYGHSNTTIDLSKVPPELVSAFHLDDPSALDEPKVHINRNIPDRKAYSRVWEEVKAA